MNKMNAIRRSLVNYAVLLGVLSAMVLVMNLSGHQVHSAVDTLEAVDRQVGDVSR